MAVGNKRKQPDTFNPYAAGKKVYNGVSGRPTHGQVDPRGYIKRELNKKKNTPGVVDRVAPNSRVNTNNSLRGPFGLKLGGDGKSDSRSGLAANALRNQRHDQIQKDLRPAPNAGPSRPSRDTDRDFAGDAPTFNQPETIKVNPNGQLDLPYDNDFSWGLLNVKSDANQRLLELQQQAQQQALDYTRIKRDANYDYDDAKRDTLNQASARGMAFSSGYGYNVAENARSFNNFMNDLEQNNTLFNQGIGSQRMQIENALNEYIRMAALQQAMNLEPEAGDLGYGQDTVEPSYEAPNSGNAGNGNSNSNNNNNKPQPNKVDMSNFPKIGRLLDRYDGDKSKIVNALVGKGNAGSLGDNQLRAIGFGKTFINNHDKPEPKRKPAPKKDRKKGKR